MGSVGDCYGNAMMESFWSSCLIANTGAPRTEQANAIFDYIEIFHNQQRRHSRLGMLTPIEYENTSSWQEIQ